MRDELLADRPAESTTLVAHTAGQHAGSRKRLHVMRSIAHSVGSRYTRVRDLPIRTLFLITLGAYIALTAAVVFGSPLDIIDRVAAASDLAKRFPDATPWVLHYVMLGQRGPSSHVAFVYLVYRAVRQRSWQPRVFLFRDGTGAIRGSRRDAKGDLRPGQQPRRSV